MPTTAYALRLTDVYLLLIRLLLGFIFVSAGLCKLTAGQFGQLIGPPTADMAPGLAGIWEFLAVSQVLTGALVLSGRWGLLGLLALVPLNVGILAYTVGNQWGGTPFVNGFLLGLNLLTLAAEWPSLRFLLLPEVAPPTGPPRLVALWPGWGLPVAVVGLLGGAAGGAVMGAPVIVTVGLGTLGCAVAWAHALAAPALSRLDRLAVALPGLAVVALCVAPSISGMRALPIMLFGVMAGVIAVVLPAAARLRRRTR